MKSFSLFVLSFLIVTNSFGQIKFEKGYLIGNDDQQLLCFINNRDWKNSPKGFEYRLTENDEIKIGNLATVKEFGIFGFSKFIRVDTKIDRSSLDLSDLSRLMNPVWSQEQLFLKVLIQGKASLYIYEENNSTKFFYSSSDSSIKQLIYKEYLGQNNQIHANSSFQQQLWNDVRCGNTTPGSIKNLNYKQSELRKYFYQYNTCTGDSNIVYEQTNKKAILKFKITPGINLSSLSISTNLVPDWELDFGKRPTFRIGFEAEYIFPFNKNKWGIVLEPSYQYFNAGKNNQAIKYQAIELALGLRHYFYINSDTKVFANMLLNTNIGLNFDSKIDITNSHSLDISCDNNLALGAGMAFKTISLELRYYTIKQLLFDYVYWYTDYQTFAFIMGIKLF